MMSVVFRVRTSVLTCRHYVTAAAGGLRETPASSSFVAGQRLQVHTATVHRSTNLLKKLLNKSKKKTWYMTPPQTGSSNPWAAVRPTRKTKQEDSHRCKVLNSLLFKAVNDLLTSGQVSHDLYNYSPQICKVSLAADFSSCRVFWQSSGESKRDELIQRELDKNAPGIRYLIMSQQIMGGVPPLVFIRDKQHAAMVEIDMLLQEADFGPDPTEDSLNDRHVPLSTVSTVSSAVAKPALFGVDHEALNRQISEWRQRSKGKELEETPSRELTQEQLSALAEHRKQQIIKKKKKKAPAIDDDVTPRAFLLAQHDDVTSRRGGREEEEESLEEGTAFKEEKAQLQELMSHEDRKL